MEVEDAAPLFLVAVVAPTPTEDAAYVYALLKLTRFVAIRVHPPVNVS